MKRFACVLAAAAFLVALAKPIFAEVKTVKGEVIEVACYTKRGEAGHGEGHANCAMGCAKKGAEMGILSSDGVFVIAGDYTKESNAKLLEYIAKQVEAKGEVTEKDGKKVITVTSMAAAK